MKQTHQSLKQFVPLLRFSFQEMKQGARQAYHATVAYMANNSFVWQGDAKVIEPSLLKFSAGSLIGPHNASAQWQENGIKITWTNNSWAGSARPYDKALVVAINLEENVISWTYEGESREKREHFIVLNSPKATHWHVYLAFSQGNWHSKKTIVSDSVYLGKIDRPV